jgi:Zn-dependent metalloprotease
VKLLNQGIALAVIGAGLAAAPVLHATAGPAAPAAADNGVRAMRNEADGTVAVSSERATGRVGFIRLRGQGDLLPSVGASTAATAAAKATAYLDTYAANFGARPGELTQDQVTRTPSGWTVTYTQRYRGVDVFGSMLRAQVDEQGDLTSVNGFAAPDLSLSTVPRISAARAGANAVGVVRAQPPGAGGAVDTSGIRAASTDLVVYRKGSTKGEAGEAVLAWNVEVTNGDNVRDVVLLDAGTGKVVNRYSLVTDALDRHLIEAAGSDDPATFTEVWKEGDPFPGALNADQQNEVVGTGDAYWFFKNVFGRDSYDGAGHSMTTVNNDGRINCPNANWNGATTNYCNGVTADDVVAHEWGHAYTEFTHGLIYQWQSGALNESYSDIWGETVDLINGRMDADEGDITTPRPVGQCSTHSPPQPLVTINSPAAIAKVCDSAAASFGPALTLVGITSDVIPAVDAANADGPTTDDACTALTNAGAVTGHIALVKRGTCGFTVKVKNAQNAGATAVLVQDNVEAAPGGLGGADPTITIPSVRIRLSDGNTIRTAIAGGSAVNVTMKDGAGVRVDSFRWLMGEDSPAFNGAIRDMWVPTCYGDPGKVSDAQYFCATDDNGGVHSNSGVPNHGYALLVDGGTYNGQTVTGIGLDKAAAIYFRAMTVYQTPTSDFGDHADALAASCRDLTGQPINRLTVVPNAPPVAAPPITPADCAQVGAMAAAVELRRDPTECNFQPLFAKGAPALCGAGFSENVLWNEDFEDGLVGWGTDQQVAFPGGFGRAWTTVTNAVGHASRVAFGTADGRLGQCTGGANDFSSRDSILSPVVELPTAGTLRAPRLSFEHSIASEPNVDGGNVKVSINGAPFAAVPAAAYLFNAPGTLLPSAAGNTNPMAGEQAFTGSDGGTNTTAFGTSIIDLAALGAKAGDSVQVRLDIGRDGCGGVSGWWVDNLKLSICKLAVKVTAAHVPEPSKFGKASDVNVTVARDGNTGPTPTGTVTLTEGGASVGQGTLAAGSSSIALPARLGVGRHAMTATYSGNDSLSSSAMPVVVTVVRGKALTDTRLTVRPRSVARGDAWTAVVKVMAGKRRVDSGKVKLLVDDEPVARHAVNGGRARFVVEQALGVGNHKVVAKYLGTGTKTRSKDDARLRVVR